MDFINKIFRGDKVVWTIFLFMCLISIVEVYSATSTLAYRRNYWEPIMRHCVFLTFGACIALFCHSIHPKYFKYLFLLLPISWGFLLATKIIGNSVNGADRWISVAGISFQPSEFAKFFLIITTALLLSKLKENENGKPIFWIIVTCSGITCLFILIDNFSTAALLFAAIYIMMFVGQIPLKRMMKLTGVVLLMGILFICFIKFVPTGTMNKILPRAVTWKERFADHSTSEEEIVNHPQIAFNDDNYQVSHSKIAIARGGLFGKMPGNGQERDFLPQAYSDFIYSIIIEEMGLIGGLVVALLYLILFIRCGIIASRCEKLFPKYLVIGSGLIIFIQALANMAVAVNLIPVTGQPLPLISRGGTSTLITCAYIGIILSVSRFETPKGIETEESIAAESEEEKEKAFTEENVNAGEI